MRPRIILHVDLDAFFASVEEREHPEYRGKPLIVGADPKDGKGRGVVSTCNYEARRFGVRSGMPISRAWNLCKEAIFLPVNHELYERVSNNIMKILKSYADKFEQVSIDEAFLDISEKAKDFKEAEKLAKAIKEEILNRESLTCSIGIGPNKLVAKIASDFHKPDGLTIVEEKAVKNFLAPLQVDKLWGIGKKTKDRLNAMGIRTIGELASYDVAKLKAEFGALGIEFHRMAQGIDESEIVEEWIPKSFSREHTFEEDTLDKAIIHGMIDELFEDVIKEVEENGFIFKTLTIKIRYEDFETHTHSKTFSYPIAKPDSVKEVAHRLLDPFLQSKKAIRLVGVRASNLILKKKQKTLEE
ncbi:MAG: DNA polymerase IV [Candidatus Bathyarchaeia archaeon]